MFQWKETKNHSLKRIIDVSSSDHHQLRNDEVELRMGKKSKPTKKNSLNFLTYLLKINLKPTWKQCPIQKLVIRKWQSILKLNLLSIMILWN